MFKRSITLALLAGALFVTGCASVPMASPQSDAAAKTFLTSPSKANVYIYRHESFGAAIKMPLLIDNVAVGDTAAKTYVLKQLDPGQHVILSKTEVDATLVLDAEAGSNYFVWQEVKLGLAAARSQLHLVNEATGKDAVMKCRLVQ